MRTRDGGVPFVYGKGAMLAGEAGDGVVVLAIIDGVDEVARIALSPDYARSAAVFLIAQANQADRKTDARVDGIVRSLMGEVVE